MAKPKETAYELDPNVVGGNDAHPFVFGGFPGLWRVGKAIHPEALGLTVTRMRELIKEFDLPLLEVQVDEGSAAREFEVAPNHIASPEPLTALEPATINPPEATTAEAEQETTE